MIKIATITESILNKIRSMIENEEVKETIQQDLPLSLLWPMLESIRVIELVVAIEKEYDIILPDELLGHGSKWTTIGDLASEVGRLANEKERSRSPGI
ncbi:hypothetical protein BBD42_24965 [Paenibacillus sp. BIHB 4019]|uniref:Carrier domain-containing protein n=1 Tax=Paenibacillus sp. BIHB 4019 TaxID=1870819 RepID=A0A1B2DNV5_9BACL|nr:acyl carrier protein [Paenibacillus sp. BIHB 4019]ANY69372.1 hypothetical protein BBD42_24965 [Paenibacillus sp. BIHB 4019]